MKSPGCNDAQPGAKWLDLALQWRTRCRKMEMRGGVVGKHAPANANTLIMMRAAAIEHSPLLGECLDQARMSSLVSLCQIFGGWGRGSNMCPVQYSGGLIPAYSLV